MRGSSALAAALLPVSLAVPLAAPTAGAVSGSDQPVDHEVLFTIADPRVHESSGLVDAGPVVYTVNDSGSDPVLFHLDPRNGRTVAVTPFAAAVEDTEALAPGRGGRVWVGDIGDNLGERPSVSVYDVRPGRAGARRYDLTYPDGPRDAEALLAHPETGRLFVVSKRVFGGVVYAAPRRLDTEGPNRMESFAQVGGLVTGGEFLPDGEHVLLRTYGDATLYTFPGFEALGTVTLPEQRQGEALSVSPEGRVLLSSEGVRPEVLRIEIPAGLGEPPTTTPSPTGSSQPAVPSQAPSRPGETSAPSGPATSAREPQGPDVGDALRVVAVGALLALLGWRLQRLRVARRRGQCRR